MNGRTHKHNLAGIYRRSPGSALVVVALAGVVLQAKNGTWEPARRAARVPFSLTGDLSAIASRDTVILA